MTSDEIYKIYEQYPADEFDLIFDESGSLIAVVPKRSTFRPPEIQN